MKTLLGTTVLLLLLTLPTNGRRPLSQSMIKDIIKDSLEDITIGRKEDGKGPLSQSIIKDTIRESLEDINNGRKMEEDAAQNTDYEESSTDPDIIEGDIKVLPTPKPKEQGDNEDKRSLYVNKKWPNGVLIYTINTGFTSTQKGIIARAMSEISRATCISFTQRTTEPHYATFVTGGGCSSYVGKINRAGQPITLAPGCFNRFGTIQHEILHALGITHEQNRPDRDDFVAIIWTNLRSGVDRNFQKATGTSTLDRNYDYRSVMHYPRRAFSKNGQDTIRAIHTAYSNVMGQRVGLSGGDVIDVNLMYGCKGIANHVGQWTDFDPCTDSCFQTRQRWCDRTASCPRMDNLGVETERRNCTGCNTPVNGNWGHWTVFPSCVKTASNPRTTRTRTCSNPAPKNGGRGCSGPSTDTRLCQCGGVYRATEQPQNIESPGSPAEYPTRQTCEYVISGAPGTTVKLTILSIQLEAHPTCNYDSLTIYADSSKQRKLAKLCGTAGVNGTFISTSQGMVVVFKSDGSRSGRGFTAKFVSQASTSAPPPTTRSPPPATRSPPPATRSPPPATRSPAPATGTPRPKPFLPFKMEIIVEIEVV